VRKGGGCLGDSGSVNEPGAAAKPFHGHRSRLTVSYAQELWHAQIEQVTKLTQKPKMQGQLATLQISIVRCNQAVCAAQTCSGRKNAHAGYCAPSSPRAST
jgi:hypothetical protein